MKGAITYIINQKKGLIMFQKLRKSKKLVLIAMACATFAIAGCGSDTNKSAADNGASVTWSETFDGTKN